MTTSQALMSVLMQQSIVLRIEMHEAAYWLKQTMPEAALAEVQLFLRTAMRKN